MTDGRLIAVTPEARWLPPGSVAEVWAGGDCAAAGPAIIVRLLVTQPDATGRARFFCVPTAKGLDLPTRFLGADDERAHPSEGLAHLAREVLGRNDVATRCAGYVRNVVPRPDSSYPHPTPWACVPVFVATDPDMPVVDGEWVTLQRGRAELPSRHWWPIVEHHLATATITT
jgi:hypothetical protein